MSLLPGAGAALSEILSAYRERQNERNFDLFAARVAELEDSVSVFKDAGEFLQSQNGAEHVARVLRSLQSAEGRAHREAAANAYVSGIGYGRFRPDLTLLFDATLLSLGEYHCQVLNWLYQKQGGLTLRERYRGKVDLEELVAEVDVPGAIAQKVLGDLLHVHVIFDAGINKIGGYWGLLSFSLTSFGHSLARYLSMPSDFSGEAVELESPFPPVPESKPGAER